MYFNELATPAVAIERIDFTSNNLVAFNSKNGLASVPSHIPADNFENNGRMFIGID